jgi:hypothetical protein
MYVSIHIKEQLDQIWQQHLEGLQILSGEDGTSRLVGTLPDQPALQGVLARICHLRLTLLSLETSEALGGQETAERS